MAKRHSVREPHQPAGAQAESRSSIAERKRRDLDPINSAAMADAWFQQYETGEIAYACGAKIPFTINWKASVLAATGQRFPENDAFFSYALFRKAKNLGGECTWRRYAMDADPAADKMCGKQK